MKPRCLATLLAAGLAACAQRGVTPTSTAQADSADQVMSQMQHMIADGGMRRALVEADSAWIFNARQFVEAKGLKVTFYDSTSGKKLSLVTSDSGTYQMRDNSLDFRRHVVATTPSGKVLKTEHLIYDRISNLIRSDTAFTFTGPEGNGRGNSFETDPDFRRMVIDQPRGYQKGKGMLLPGQTGGGQ
jgi:LPS export ABC transporter protein LptC